MFRSVAKPNRKAKGAGSTITLSRARDGRFLCSKGTASPELMSDPTRQEGSGDPGPPPRPVASFSGAGSAPVFTFLDEDLLIEDCRRIDQEGFLTSLEREVAKDETLLFFASTLISCAPRP